jgi:hypothetical protein
VIRVLAVTLPVTMPEMTESSSNDQLAAVRAYTSDAMGCPAAVPHQATFTL